MKIIRIYLYKELSNLYQITRDYEKSFKAKNYYTRLRGRHIDDKIELNQNYKNKLLELQEKEEAKNTKIQYQKGLKMNWKKTQNKSQLLDKDGDFTLTFSA